VHTVRNDGNARNVVRFRTTIDSATVDDDLGTTFRPFIIVHYLHYISFACWLFGFRATKMEKDKIMAHAVDVKRISLHELLVGTSHSFLPSCIDCHTVGSTLLDHFEKRQPKPKLG